MWKVLDSGHIRIVDAMGDDDAVVQAARVAYGHGTQTVSSDRTLIRYLMRHRHTTPFEMCVLKLHIRCPMDVWRQWIRHRTAHVNEYSTRYSEAIDEKMQTDPREWRTQSKSNKQGSSDLLPTTRGQWLTNREADFHRQAADLYNERLKHDVAREQARKDLPLSTYTEAYWMIDLHNLLHFLGLRMDSHAQLEIRSYANIIGAEIVSQWVPWTWEAFRDYRFNSVSLSDRVRAIMFEWNNIRMQDVPYHDNVMGALAKIWNEAIQAGWIKPIPGQHGAFTYPRSRERDEVEATLKSLAFPILWREPFTNKAT